MGAALAHSPDVKVIGTGDVLYQIGLRSFEVDRQACLSESYVPVFAGLFCGIKRHNVVRIGKSGTGT
jgi:hypothetical protein